LPQWNELPKLEQSRAAVALQAENFLRPSKNLLVAATPGNVQYAAPRRMDALDCAPDDQRATADWGLK
jgi:hypothetical protein